MLPFIASLCVKIPADLAERTKYIIEHYSENFYFMKCDSVWQLHIFPTIDIELTSSVK